MPGADLVEVSEVTPAPPRPGSPYGLRRWMLIAAAATFFTAVAALDARATYGARVTADEPQYLLTALSLGTDLDLDISDEIDGEEYRDFHETTLDQQTIELDSQGQRISPHDPLLPLLLAAPMRLGGWLAAKATLAALAGLTAAATVWFAARRLGAGERTSGVVVTAAFMAPPMTSYATQVYPEMPAALAAIVGLAAVTSNRLGPRHLVVVGAAAVALPWLGIKYAPVAAVLALWMLGRLWRPDRRSMWATALALAVMGVVYLVVHRRVYGGWTVYASGDHFVDGEFLVVGDDANYAGRTRRLLGLLVDRGFGLVAWTPAYAMAPAALVLLGYQGARRRSNAISTNRRVPLQRDVTALACLSTLAAGYATATWVALTMHGWWWPGRQIVVVLPVAIAAMALLAERVRWLLWPLLVGFAFGVVSWLWLVVEASTDRRTLIVDFESTANPLYQAWRWLLPDLRAMGTADLIGTGFWAIVLAVLVAVVLRSRAARPSPGGHSHVTAAE